MHALKFLVITLSILILLGLLLLGYGFYKKSSDPHWKLFKATTSDSTFAKKDPLVVSNLKPFGEKFLRIPKDCLIKKVEMSQRFFVVKTGDSFACQKLFIFNIKDFSILGTISINK